MAVFASGVGCASFTLCSTSHLLTMLAAVVCCMHGGAGCMHGAAWGVHDTASCMHDAA